MFFEARPRRLLLVDLAHCLEYPPPFPQLTEAALLHPPTVAATRRLLRFLFTHSFAGATSSLPFPLSHNGDSSGLNSNHSSTRLRSLFPPTLLVSTASGGALGREMKVQLSDGTPSPTTRTTDRR